MTIQLQLDGGAGCLAPCWPIVCKDCPFGDEKTTWDEFEEILKKVLI